jgi:PAS domain S-box-containing protein
MKESQMQTANLESQEQISEKLLAEQALRRSEELYRTLAKNLPNITVLLFDQDLRYLVAEGSFGATQNHTSEGLEGKTFWEVLPPEEAEKWAPIYQAALAGTQSNFEWSSNNRIYEVQALPVRNEQGEIFAGMMVLQDITQDKAAETILRAAYDQLELRIKDRTADLEATNEELRTFTYIVSHDLRAPLVNLKGFTGELRLALETVNAAINDALPFLDEEQRQAVTTACHEDIPEALNFIDSAVTRMDNLTSAVLKLSRLGRREFNFERVDMAALVQTTLQTLAHQIEQYQVEISVGPLPEVIADQTSMEQVMSNLLTNAIIYLDPNRPGKIEISAERNPAETIFHIRDNGRGIAC